MRFSERKGRGLSIGFDERDGIRFYQRLCVALS